MFRKIVQRSAIAAACVGMLLACNGEAPSEAGEANSETPPEIAERQANFEAMGDAFKLIRAELEGGAPDLAAIGSQASEINTRAGNIEGKFPAETSIEDGYDTEALPSIWEKPEEFASAQQLLVEESAKLVTLAGEGDAAAVGEQVKALGGSCGNCHDQFRVDDD